MRMSKAVAYLGTIGLYLACLTLIVIAVAWYQTARYGTAGDEVLELESAQILLGEGTIGGEGITIRELDNDRALIRFSASQFEASRFGHFVHRTSTPSKLFDIQFFWRTAAAPGEFHSAALYPGGHTSFLSLSEQKEWNGVIREIGIVITSPAGSAIPLNGAVAVSGPELRPQSATTTAFAIIESWIRFWDWDSRSINTVAPPPNVKASWPPVALVGPAAVLAGLIVLAARTRDRRRQIGTIVISAWGTLFLAALGAGGLHLVAGHKPESHPIYDKPLIELVERAQSHFAECSARVRIAVYSKNVYRKRRASYMLRPCNSGTGKYLLSQLPADTYVLIIRPSRAEFDQSKGLLKGLGPIRRVDRIFSASFGELYRIADEGRSSR